MLRALTLAVFLLTAGQFAQAQDRPKRVYEAGIEVVNYNPSIKSVCLSPEIYYDVLRARDKTTRRDNLNGSPDFTYQETTTMHRPAMQLRATIAF